MNFGACGSEAFPQLAEIVDLHVLIIGHENEGRFLQVFRQIRNNIGFFWSHDVDLRLPGWRDMATDRVSGRATLSRLMSSRQHIGLSRSRDARGRLLRSRRCYSQLRLSLRTKIFQPAL